MYPSPQFVPVYECRLDWNTGYKTAAPLLMWVMPIAMCCRLRRLWTVAHRADVNSYIRLSSEPARARTRLRPVPPPSLRGLEGPRGYPRCLPGQSVEDARSQGEGA